MTKSRRGKRLSGYADKLPYAYSALYRQWHEARKAGRIGEADRLSRQHAVMCARHAPLLGDDRVADCLAINREARGRV